MQIVIDIPDRIHYGIEKGITVNGSSASQIVLDAVKNGTPLPKGHGGLIDENYLLSFLQCEEYETCTWSDCSDCDREKSIKRRGILDAPTIIEAESKENKND